MIADNKFILQQINEKHETPHIGKITPVTTCNYYITIMQVSLLLNDRLIRFS